MVVVEPAHSGFVGLQSDAQGVFLGAATPLVGGGEVVPAHVAGADEEDVAGLGGGTLVCECGFDFGDGDFVAADGGGGVAVFGFVPAELR